MRGALGSQVHYWPATAPVVVVKPLRSFHEAFWELIPVVLPHMMEVPSDCPMVLLPHMIESAHDWGFVQTTLLPHMIELPQLVVLPHMMELAQAVWLTSTVSPHMMLLPHMID